MDFRLDKIQFKILTNRINIVQFLEKEGRLIDDIYPKFMKIECSNYYDLDLVNLER